MAVKVKDVRIREAVDLWYGAGFGERLWAEALRATADLIGGGGAAVLDIDRTNAQVGRIYVDMRYSLIELDDSLNEYVARMNRINPRMLFSLKRPGPHILSDYRILPEAALGRNEFYDWIERYHGVRYFIGARIFDDGPRSLCASVEFTRRHGHVDEAAAETFRHIIPHIANAWRVSNLVQALDDTKSFTELLLGQQLCGVVGLRADGTILFMNAAAEGAVAAGDGLLTIEGYLRAVRAASDRTLQGMIARVLHPRPDEPPDRGGAVAVLRPSGRTPFALRVMPCVHGSEYRDGELPAALVMIADSDRRTVPSDETLRALGLSPTEMRVAQQLARGRTLAEAARDVGMSHNTARAHLRSIFAKTQARSQVELVRILCEFARLDAAGPP